MVSMALSSVTCILQVLIRGGPLHHLILVRFSVSRISFYFHFCIDTFMNNGYKSLFLNAELFLLKF